MTDITPPPEEATESDDDEKSENASMHVDYRVFEVEVTGSGSDDVEDVNEVMEERLQSALKHIEALKRTDFELDDEFDIDRSSSPGGMMTQ